ncbi:MAG: NADH-quinone oxidoreductase subunit N [Verrucomicrobiales bacterium]
MPAYLLEIVVIVAGLLLLMIEAFVGRLDSRTIGYASLVVLAVVFGALFFVDKPAGGYWGFYATDASAFFYKGLAVLCTLVVTIMSLEYAPVLDSYRDGAPGKRGLGEFLCLPLFICAGLMWMASMTDLIGIFVTLELVTITFYVMVAYMRRNAGSLEAGAKYLILGALSTGFLVYGIAWLFGMTGHTSLAGIKDALQFGSAEKTPLLFGIALILVGMAFKVGAAPFQFWIPDVYQGAPTPVTAFLSVGSKSAGFIVLVRILDPLLVSALRQPVLTALAVMAGATLVVGNLAAMAQSNFKRLLAYSSISHAGFLLLALAAGQPFSGLSPATVVAFYLATYLAMTLLSFLILSVVRKHGGTDELSAFDGLGKRSPLLAFALLVSAASLAGVPLTAGFFGKFFVITLAAGAHQWALLVLAIIGAAAGFYYYFKVVRSMYWNDPPFNAPVINSSRLTRAAVSVLAAAVLVFGVFPRPLFGWLN